MVNNVEKYDNLIDTCNIIDWEKLYEKEIISESFLNKNKIVGNCDYVSMYPTIAKKISLNKYMYGKFQ